VARFPRGNLEIKWTGRVLALIRRKPRPDSTNASDEYDDYGDLQPNIPRPDPSTITTKLIQREITALRDLFEARMVYSETAIAKIEKALEERNKPNIVAYISGAGLLITLMGAFWLAGVAPIKEQSSALAAIVQHQADQIEAARQQYPTQQQFEEFKSSIDGRADRMYLDKLPRAEFDAWKAERDKTIASMQAQINRIEQMERTEHDKPVGSGQP